VQSLPLQLQLKIFPDMPYRIDLFAVFIFLGMVQAVFLCFFFFSKTNRKIKSNVFHGLMLLSITLCVLEMFLMYTGYIVDCLYLVDFSEPISFLIGPFFYLMVVSLIHGDVKKKYYWHLAFAVIYLILVIPFYMLPEDVKYNAWIDSYKPGLPFRDCGLVRETRIFWVTDNHTDLTMISLAFYAILCLWEVVKVFKTKGESFFRSKHPVLRKLRGGTIQLVSATLLLLIIKLFYENDTGDHFFAVYTSIIIYITSFRVISQSGFFQPASLADSTRKANLSADLHAATLAKLKHVMESEKPFLQSGFSLPDLAQRLGTTVHILSQAINEGLSKSFFEMIAEYRVEEAKKLLKEKQNIKVEEIAEQVGYNSKSSFNTAFKKITGKTPSEFRNS
jgi:AraC-like DNA-binding protein